MPTTAEIDGGEVLRNTGHRREKTEKAKARCPCPASLSVVVLPHYTNAQRIDMIGSPIPPPLRRPTNLDLPRIAGERAAIK
jgi:hypothetical protein